MKISTFLDRSSIIAKPGFNRWLVPPAALAIHLSIGEIYAYSVFNKPMTQLIGITESTPEDWSLVQVGYIFSIAIVVLGASAALFGKWLERVGPRKAMFVAAICFGSGFLVSSIGIELHNIWIVYFGQGILGGIGLGIGYISPVSTLIKWFPDKPGLATGLAIMGFGGGAMVAAPFGVSLMDYFKSATSVGLMETFIVMGIAYFILMMFGMWLVRIPAKDWKPKGFDPEKEAGKKKSAMISTHHVDANTAIKTPQFYLLFVVLLVNVSAGIGVLGQASVMIQEMFSASVVGSNAAVTAASAAGFVGLLSLFNMGGRFAWSSLSDRIGRKNTYSVFFLLGILLYCLIPTLGHMANIVLFILAFSIIISMYGGGFATIPAYLRDMFGTFEVGAIHGRLLLAWSLAAVIGPQLVNNIRAYQIDTLGMPKAEAYSTTMYILAGLLVIGLVCNLLVKPVHEKYHLKQ
ncbi:OFA family MFS transporter [Aquimarina sp. U1-2]|uniref:L-lactate MFS transporter n=1 Tax=Aquimarina sp. U1-2 TaxID=2823141 RepID=UPI001AEC9FBE|nr:OFA family MFS transporter [Aquimarina sp. U1-2]MBP2831013.1 OFA family MFS transporter [Aquimarina sp. U1-2]